MEHTREHLLMCTHTPQPANPIFEAEQCQAYIAYTCKECFNRCKVRIAGVGVGGAVVFADLGLESDRYETVYDNTCLFRTDTLL